MLKPQTDENTEINEDSDAQRVTNEESLINFPC